MCIKKSQHAWEHWKRGSNNAALYCYWSCTYFTHSLPICHLLLYHCWMKQQGLDKFNPPTGINNSPIQHGILLQWTAVEFRISRQSLVSKTTEWLFPYNLWAFGISKMYDAKPGSGSYKNLEFLLWHLFHLWSKYCFKNIQCAMCMHFYLILVVEGKGTTTGLFACLLVFVCKKGSTLEKLTKLLFGLNSSREKSSIDKNLYAVNHTTLLWSKDYLEPQPRHRPLQNRAQYRDWRRQKSTVGTDILSFNPLYIKW